MSKIEALCSCLLKIHYCERPYSLLSKAKVIYLPELVYIRYLFVCKAKIESIFRLNIINFTYNIRYVLKAFVYVFEIIILRIPKTGSKCDIKLKK